MVSSPLRLSVASDLGQVMGELVASESLKELLRSALRLGASDVHLKAGAPPVIRLHGELTPLEGFSPIPDETLWNTLHSMTTPRQQQAFQESRDLDFAWTLEEGCRFRVNVAQQRGTLSFSFRVLPGQVPAWEDLAIPIVSRELVAKRSGLILVGGPTGSGKTTTLAALIDFINEQLPLRIVTIEDPIEFVHADKRSQIIQREVGEDTVSFAEGLRRALRQDPDVIMIGEMRDLETIATALTAAETGHLVLATLHAQSATQTVERITDVFPPERQALVRQQFSSVFLASINQRLLRRRDRPGRVAAFEVMTGIPAIRHLIREGKLHEIPTYMEMNAEVGMRTLERSLAELVKAGIVAPQEARETAIDPDHLEALLGRSSKLAKAPAHDPRRRPSPPLTPLNGSSFLESD